MSELRASVRDQVADLVVDSSTALDVTLEQAELEARSLGMLNVVMLTALNGDQLSIVIGGQETVVGYIYGHGNPPYYVSSGIASVDVPVLTAYIGLEHHTEYPRCWVVPMAAGRKAAHEFLIAGQRPQCIDWTEV